MHWRVEDISSPSGRGTYRRRVRVRSLVQRRGEVLEGQEKVIADAEAGVEGSFPLSLPTKRVRWRK